MGRSFSRLTTQNAIEDFTAGPFYHQASRSWFEMLRRDDGYYQRRYQVDPTGHQINVEEKKVDFVLGSGNHARAYLHLTPANTLQELPLGWYAEKGGHWGMNPGYDQPDHPFSRRVADYECVGCHNASPAIPAKNEKFGADAQFVPPLPEGVDCQRCHGYAAQHVEAARKPGATAMEMRALVVNPARLTPERAMEVCMQCHLETDSSLVSHSILEYSRSPFSYKPGEPLGAFRSFFEKSGRSQDFQIAQGAYRFRESPCFLKSGGKFQCITCHDPHIPAKEQNYSAVCETCHTTQQAHFRSGACTDCHMPKRRTADAVHVVMTDHRIQIPARTGNLLAEIPVAHETGIPWRGALQLYYPPVSRQSPEITLRHAIAGLRERSGSPAQILGLAALIQKLAPKEAEYYVEAGDALRASGQVSRALEFYRIADRKQPGSPPILRMLAMAQLESGDGAGAIMTLKRSLQTEPRDAVALQLSGQAFLARGDAVQARTAFEKAIAIDPEALEAHHALALIAINSGDRDRAEAEFREAIRIQPNIAEPRANLANLLSLERDYAGASLEFEEAIRLRPNFGAAHFGYAAMLKDQGNLPEARKEAELAVRDEPGSKAARELLDSLGTQLPLR